VSLPLPLFQLQNLGPDISPSAPESTESSIRYAAYATRIRTALLSAQRYVAYTSDVGESFRPVAHPNLVRAAYGISWAYLAGDVAHEGYKAYCANQRTLHPEGVLLPGGVRTDDGGVKAGGLLTPGVVTPLEDYRTVIVQRALFQGIASMGLPMLTIHSIVRYAGRAMKDVKNPRIRMWGPVGLGLSVVPVLPYLFDKPVEGAVEFVFHEGFKAIGGQKAVGDAPVVGREKRLEEAGGRGKGGKEL
jgi:fission process protein 1